MTFQKYGAPEKLVVFTGEEVGVVEAAFQKTGKTAVSDFTEKELDELWKALGREVEKSVKKTAKKVKE